MAHYDLVIIGGGPAGLAAAAYAFDAELNVALVAPDLGGKVNYGFALRDRPHIDTVWGAELVRQFETIMHSHPEHHIQERLTRVVREETGLFRLTLVGTQDIERTIRARTVIVATGAQPQQLFIPGEKEYWGLGVSFSAISHASFFHDKDVVVVGRGERALVATLQLASLARMVHFLPTMALNTMDARVVEIQDRPNVELMEGWELIQILGDKYVTQAVVVKEYKQRTLDVEGIFIQLGLLPNKEFLRGVVEFDPETGRIPVNQRCETGVPGLFAAGAVTDIYAEQVPVAVGEGIKAALSAWEYLVTHAEA